MNKPNDLRIIIYKYVLEMKQPRLMGAVIYIAGVNFNKRK